MFFLHKGVDLNKPDEHLVHANYSRGIESFMFRSMVLDCGSWARSKANMNLIAFRDDSEAYQMKIGLDEDWVG